MSKPNLKVVSGTEHRPPMASAADLDAIQAELIPVDRAFRDMETKWGTGRLETLVSPATLLSFRKGFALYSEAITNSDVAAVRRLAPKIVQALAAMDAEATAAGHEHLSPEVWETLLPDGRVLAIVRSNAGALAVGRQREGRETVVYTMAEIARLLPEFEQLNAVKVLVPGAKVTRLVRKEEGFAESFARTDPLHDLLHGE